MMWKSDPAEVLAMGWRTDWLYHRIFDEVAQLWKRAQREGRGKFGPAPDSLVVRERSGADWEQVLCLAGVVRAWAYQGAEFDELPLAADDDIDLGEQRG